LIKIVSSVIGFANIYQIIDAIYQRSEDEGNPDIGNLDNIGHIVIK
jgi:hypothetical protein